MISPLDILSLETWILIITSLLLLRLYIHKKWQVLNNLNIPHDPPTLMGMGNMGSFMKDSDNMFKGYFERKKKFGPICGSYNGLNVRIQITDPDILKQIYIKEFSTFPDRQRNFKEISGKEMNTALTAVSGNQWKRIRNTLTPTFSSSKLKQMSGILEECADSFVRNIGTINSDENGRFDAAVVFGKLSLDAICSSAFGVKVDSQSKPNGKEPKVAEMAQKMFNHPIVRDPMFLICLLFPSFEHVLAKFDYSIFPRKYTNYFSKLTDSVMEDKKSKKQRMDIMQTMIDSEISDKDVKNGANKGMTKVEITGNSMIMLFAGYETTSNAMLFLAYNLALHKDAQHHVREEVLAALHKHGGITYEAAQELKYLTQCINESMRLYAPIPGNSRYCEEDITINGITIPKGATIDVPVYGMGRDGDIWEDPLIFNPDRMEDMSKIDPMIYQPFGAGPRNCIGMRFALLEIKITFAKLLLKFDLDVCEDTPPPPLEMTVKSSMKPKDQVLLKVVEHHQ